MKDNKKVIISSILGVIALCIITLSLTYAYWQINKNQTGENVVNTACLEITLENELDDILLKKTYPMKDDEGNTLTPYKFTVKNKCKDNASYVINLESMEQTSEGVSIEEANRLLPKYLKVKLNETGQNGITNILEETDITDPLLPNAYESHQLLLGYLTPEQEKNYELRLWINYDADIDATSKQYVSKINIVSTYLTKDKIPPSAELALSLCDNDITATTTATAIGEKQISKYEYNIDNKGWNDGKETNTFANQEVGNHTIKVRVTDNSGNISSEQTEQIEIKEPKTIDLKGTQVPIATCKDGLYEIEHEVTEIDNGWNTTEYRYAGRNPNNYVKFNNENWQIIGLVNVQTDTGIEQRLKIVSYKSIGEFVWNTTNSNDWTTSSLKNMLNGIYYNSSSGLCYNKDPDDYDNIEGTCNFTQESKIKGINDTARPMIDSDVIWNLGSVTSKKLNKEYYEKERGTDKYDTNQTEWTKENDTEYHNGIGLMYPSDIIYSVGGTKEKREKVYNMGTCDDGNCSTWNHFGLLLSPYEGKISIFSVSNGFDNYWSDDYIGFVYPTLYLKPDVMIVNGDGSLCILFLFLCLSYISFYFIILSVVLCIVI